jgi:FeS assembly SUF system protein
MSLNLLNLAKPRDAEFSELHDTVIDALRTVYDPEIPVNIYDLGLVYALKIDDAGNVDIDMTLSAPGCPVAQTFPRVVEARLRAVPEVRHAHVNIVWDPPWDKSRMSEPARIELGLF